MLIRNPNNQTPPLTEQEDIYVVQIIDDRRFAYDEEEDQKIQRFIDNYFRMKEQEGWNGPPHEPKQCAWCASPDVYENTGICKPCFDKHPM